MREHACRRAAILFGEVCVGGGATDPANSFVFPVDVSHTETGVVHVLASHHYRRTLTADIRPTAFVWKKPNVRSISVLAC